MNENIRSGRRTPGISCRPGHSPVTIYRSTPPEAQSADSTENATLDLPLPARNFAATQKVLLIVLAASIIIPLACLCIYGYYDLQRRFSDADELTERLTRVANEHALKVMDLNQQMERRIVDMLGDSNDADIRL